MFLRFLLAAGIICSSTGSDQPSQATERFTVQQYNSIKLGMNINDAERILGCPPGQYGQGPPRRPTREWLEEGRGGTHQLHWLGDAGGILLWVDGNGVIGCKRYQPWDGPMPAGGGVAIHHPLREYSYPAQPLVFKVTGELRPPMMGQLDKLPGVKHAWANNACNILRVDLAQATGAEDVAQEVIKILNDSKLSFIRLRNPECMQTLLNEAWATPGQVGIKYLIKYRQQAVALMRQFAAAQKLDAVTREKLVWLTEEQWYRLFRNIPVEGKKPVEDWTQVKWRDICPKITAAIVEGAKSILTADQVEKLREVIKGFQESSQGPEGQ